MKRLIVISILLAVGLAGCGSPLVDSWADRGIQGVEFGKVNIQEYHDELEEVLHRHRNRDIDAIFNDILTVGTGKVDGVVIDEKWLETHKAALKLLLKLSELDEDRLDAATKKSLDNLDQVIECFNQIKRLRKAWSQIDEVQFQIDRLTVLVAQLVADKE